jgi:hypothetical protein
LVVLGDPGLAVRDDGVLDLPGAGKARIYHATQIETFAGTEADMVSAFTLNREPHGSDDPEEKAAEVLKTGQGIKLRCARRAFVLRQRRVLPNT